MNMNYPDLDIELDDAFAFDRSARTIDVDGRLRVADCRISKANVCTYMGNEIPGYDALGLDPTALFRLYRDRKALAAAVSSFEAVPLLVEHQAVSASDPKKSLVIGSVSNVRYSHPYLVADLMVYDAEAIRLIESGAQRELSCGYRYTPRLIPGTVDGEAFDGRMLDIVGNHVALVPVGRAGRDVLVADAAPRLARSMGEAFPAFDRLWRGR